MPLAAVDTDVVMTSVQKRRGPVTAVRRVPVWCVGAFAAAAFAIVWWSSSIGLYHGPDHAIGPFRLPVAVEWALGGAAVASAVAGCTWMILRRSDRSPAGASLSPITSLWLVCAAALSAGCWRVLTAGGDGANIGRGLVALAGPFVLASMLQCAVFDERRSREEDLRQYRAWTAAIWCIALAVWIAL